MSVYDKGGAALGIARLTRTPWMPVSREFELQQRFNVRCFIEQETLPSMLSSGWSQERNRT